MKKDKVYINLLKIIACFLVIVNHTNSNVFLHASTKLPWIVSVLEFFVAKLGVPIFMMISGALMLNKNYDYKKVFKKVFKYLILLFGVSLLYKYVNNVSHDNLLIFLRQLYNNQILYPLWYLYFYIILLIMMPILQKLAQNMRNIDFIVYFIFSFIIYGGVVLLAPKYFPNLAPTNFLYFFWPYLGYVLAGYYIDNRLKIKNTWQINLSLIGGIILIVTINTLLTYHEMQINPGYYLFLDNIMLINISIPAIFLFLLIKNIATSLSSNIIKVINYCSKTTLAIYLIHIAIINHTSFIYTFFDKYLQINVAMLLYDFVILGISFVIALILLKIPYVKKLFS